ncbi:MAG: RNA methyltransferase [Kiritimatiellales bacterium]|nr:RNA methyltransferase [Kiritimatiellales bacterium]
MNREVVLLAHNIRSLWNVGSLFRTCDAFGVSKLLLTGYTALPPRREISKTALGAEETIEWEHHKEPLELIQQLKNDGYKIVSLELTDDAQDLSKYDAPKKLCLIVGHEVTGVPKELLEVSDDKVQIPMQGQKESLNVSVATGVALFQMTR